MNAEDVSVCDRIRRHMSKLVRFIELDYGLLNELVSKGILSEMKIADVEAGVNVYEKNNRLLQSFKDKSDEVCQKFLTALKSTGQHHVANFIEFDGGQYNFLVDSAFPSTTAQ